MLICCLNRPLSFRILPCVSDELTDTLIAVYVADAFLAVFSQLFKLNYLFDIKSSSNKKMDVEKIIVLILLSVFNPDLDP